MSNEQLEAQAYYIHLIRCYALDSLNEADREWIGRGVEVGSYSPGDPFENELDSLGFARLEKIMLSCLPVLLR